MNKKANLLFDCIFLTFISVILKILLFGIFLQLKETYKHNQRNRIIKIINIILCAEISEVL